MRLGRLAHDCQAKPRARLLAGAVGAVEALEHVGEVGLGEIPPHPRDPWREPRAGVSAQVIGVLPRPGDQALAAGERGILSAKRASGTGVPVTVFNGMTPAHVSNA